MHAINLSDKSIKFLSKIKFDFLTDFDEIEIYFTEFKAAELAYINQNNLLHFNQNNLSYKLVNFTCSETVLSSSITIYNNKKIIRALSKIINHHDI